MESLTFVGTATTVLELGPFTVLTDPNFLHRGQRAYLGKGLWSRRLTDPAFEPEDLPELDAVVLSHLHGDHFDRVARRGLARDQPVFTTPAAARRLTSWGFEAQGMLWWERLEIAKENATLSVEAVPAVHARGVMRLALPPVMGAVLEYREAGTLRRRIYISGDTVTGDHVSKVAERYPDIDVAVVHLGGTRILLHTVTMDAGQGVDFLRRTRPALAVPVHHDDYKVFRSPLSDFLDLAMRAGLSTRIEPVERGGTLHLDGSAGTDGRGTPATG